METLAQQVDQYLCENKARWVQLGKTLQGMPEIGFCEHETGAYVERFFKELGLEPSQAVVTGRIATLRGRSHDVTVALEGELDAIYCPDHPMANPETGLAHACGHNIQITALLAVAQALKETRAMARLDGDVRLIAVPAEECIPAPLLDMLQKNGAIALDSGKKELIRLNLLEGIDVVLGCHALVNDRDHPDAIMINSSCNGLAELHFTFHGQTAHSMVCPERGVNALNAAVLAINGIQALRESFDPQEYIRVSYNLTQGGVSLGNVPDLAQLEVVIAAKTMGALDRLRAQVERIARCSAEALGCTVDSKPGVSYLPYEVDMALLEQVQDCGEALTGVRPRIREHNFFSNDLGNVSQMIPSAQVVFGGFQGGLHSAQFHVTDEEMAYVLPARTLAAVIVRLLENGAGKAKAVKTHFAQTRREGEQ
ncbi:amidohydrolase [Pseudoflavonifractor sp. 524-17]|uniref:amidohydrolase n=1 Tax=Pseudoflavonifractor sp. 524-17 TaxID=2304577 RepID=UPI00137A72E6|nr:amidohydrolase [Pseudoflavonifractor sp. 524-17]